MCSQHNQSGPYVFEIAKTDESLRLGRGAYGEVEKYVLTDGRTVAGKKIHESLLAYDPEQSMNTHIIAESEKLSQLSHPNIVQYIGLAYRNTASPILLTELLLMSLSDYLDQSNEQNEIIPPHTKKSILLDVSVGLQYLHSIKVIHGDLTVKNVLLTEEKKAKICDFGMSKVLDPEKLYTRLTGCPGNVLYMPPEAHTTDYFKVENTALDRFDVFSFGVLILHVFTQKMPKPSSLFDENHQPRKETERRQQYIDEVRNCTFRQLTVQCLSNQPRERPSSSDVVQRIRGSQFQGISIFVCNEESTQDEYPQDVLFKLVKFFGLKDLWFADLSSEALHVLLKAAVEETIKCHLPVIALFILAKEKNGKLYDGNKKLMPIEDILSHFHNPRLDEKPKLFFLQHEDRSHYPCNSIILPQVLPSFNLHQSLEADEALEDLLISWNVHYESTIISKCGLTIPTSNQKGADEELQALDFQYQLIHAIWQEIRNQTIHLLQEHRDEVFKLIRNTRIVKIAGAATSLVVGGVLAVTGVALLPFTFGASIVATVAGAAVGAAGSGTVLAASITSRVMSNKKLRMAQDHISLDKQLSGLVNKAASSVSQAIQQNPDTFITVYGGVGIGGRLGVGIAKGIGAGVGAGIEASGAALRAGGAVLPAVAIGGGIFGVAALVVTVPMDIYQIVANAKDIATSHKDQGKEKDPIYVWYSEMIEHLRESQYSNTHSEETGAADLDDDGDEQELINTSQ